MTNITYLPLILSGVLLNALAQLSLKQGAGRLSNFSFDINNIMPILFSTIFNPWIFIGLLMYGVSVIFWILALSRVDVSYAYPMLSIGYIIVAVFGWAIFGEDMSLNRIMGIFVIIIGVILISKP